LASARYRYFLIDLCALGHAGDLGRARDSQDGLEQPVTSFASHALSRLHRKLLKRGRGFETLSQAERHRVRIALKKLRYAVDFFGAVFGQDRKSKFFKKLAKLQDDLGRMNDVAVAQTMLTDLIGDAADDDSEPAESAELVFAAGSVLGWHRRRAAEIDRRLVKHWHSFARAKPFWLRKQSRAA
jgi:triphosphatase